MVQIMSEVEYHYEYVAAHAFYLPGSQRILEENPEPFIPLFNGKWATLTGTSVDFEQEDLWHFFPNLNSDKSFHKDIAFWLTSISCVSTCSPLGEYHPNFSWEYEFEWWDSPLQGYESLILTDSHLLFCVENPIEEEKFQSLLVASHSDSIEEIEFVRANTLWTERSPLLRESSKSQFYCPLDSEVGRRKFQFADFHTPTEDEWNKAIVRCFEDDDLDSKLILAAHPNATVRLLERLALDINEIVRTCVFNNPNSTAEIRASAALLGVSATMRSKPF